MSPARSLLSRLRRGLRRGGRAAAGAVLRRLGPVPDPSELAELQARVESLEATLESLRGSADEVASVARELAALAEASTGGPRGQGRGGGGDGRP
ncbi:hypothetical protein L6R50_24325 [Myxococcota bacterium]|nr:hypothetical protein [Myxococcota bacterium]